MIRALAEVTEDRRPPSQDVTSAETMLDNLSRRPGVKSTLILARKDGSIIKASGVIASDRNIASQRRSIYGTESRLTSDRSSTDESNSDTVDEPGQKTEEQRLTPAQILAASIYSFVASATAVSDAVAETDERNAFLGHEDQPPDHMKEAHVQSQTKSDVQLLRLRLRKQEVIIFPDPSYLCCVIQDLERTR